MAGLGTTAARARGNSASRSFFDGAQALALRLDPRRVAVVTGALILLLVAFGVLHMVFESRFGAFDLDGEKNVQSSFSAGLWVAIALLALLLGLVEAWQGVRVWRALFAAALFVGADELGEIHERLERIVGIDWQILYSPLALLAAILWVLAVRRLRGLGIGLWLFVAGTACGIVSQAIEALEYGAGDRRVAAFNELVVAEEMLEMSAAVLVGLALLGALRVVCRDARA